MTVTTVALAAIGAGLAVAAILRSQFPLLDSGERLALVARWTAVGASAGAAVGLAGAPLFALVVRRGVRAALAVALVAGLAVAVVRTGRRPYSPWAPLGTAREYPPLDPRPASPAAPNLVLVTIDTLRQDHLDVYGYARRTAPNLAALARDGVVFETAIAQAPETLHSLASLLTGLYPQALASDFERRGGAGGFVSSAFHTLAERLVAAGYDTAGFVANAYLQQQNGFGQGFRHFDDRSGMYWWRATDGGKRAEHVVAPALAWLAQARPPFFLWVHVMDPHHPYEPAAPAPWEADAAAAAAPYAAAYHGLSVAGYTHRLKDIRAGRRALAPGELDYLVGRYDAEILQVDAEVARLAAGLRARGFDERNTVLAVTADHGEEFADHGGMLHGHTLYDELIRVPLVVWGRDVAKGRRIAAQVQLVDLSATLLDLAGLDVSAVALDGRSLRAALATGTSAEHPALSFRDTRYVAYRTREWKLVAAFAPYELTPPSWLPWDGLPTMARVALGRPHRPDVGLWRLVDDPRERRNLVPEDRVRGRALYATLLAERRAHPPRVVEADEAPGLDRADRRALRALGYVQ